eukprot:TRINITY_DN913_c0_g1_i1.p1 TRINITY_DN913_c0_g1~~TRINITY_DN913_c0_g1_i1.p1  ORF type:complete len:136 (+),score=59.57 TRINITY_DN913_c0_g1_i1:63-410(+)
MPLSSGALFQAMVDGSAMLKSVQGLNASVHFEFTDSNTDWVVYMRPDLKVTKGKPATEADCTFRMSEQTFMDLAQGKDAMQLFMEGKVELDGDTDTAMKLTAVMKKAEKVSKALL